MIRCLHCCVPQQSALHHLTFLLSRRCALPLLFLTRRTSGDFLGTFRAANLVYLLNNKRHVWQKTICFFLFVFFVLCLQRFQEGTGPTNKFQTPERRKQLIFSFRNPFTAGSFLSHWLIGTGKDVHIIQIDWQKMAQLVQVKDTGPALWKCSQPEAS